MAENTTPQENHGLQENRVFAPPAAFAAQAAIPSMAAYDALCAEAAADYEGFWARLAREHLDWQTPFTSTLDEANAPAQSSFTPSPTKLFCRQMLPSGLG